MNISKTPKMLHICNPTLPASPLIILPLSFLQGKKG